MEIKIDTQKDSKDEIKQAIKLLQNVIGDNERELRHEMRTDMFANNEPKQTNNTETANDTPNEGLFDIFNNEETETKKEDVQTNNYYDEQEKEIKEDKKIDIVPY